MYVCMYACMYVCMCASLSIPPTPALLTQTHTHTHTHTYTSAKQIPGIRPMEPKDVPKAYALLMNYLAQFDLYINYDEAEFAHWLLPREGVIYSFVVENKEGEITDFASFYCLPSSVMNNPLHSKLYAGYSYYNVATSVPLFDLMKDLLVYAYKYNMDVFNCLDLMDNQQVFEDLKFGIGDGALQYYLYNWQTPTIEANKVALVLL
jgi:glycylpeptide N-tetradecanoyltransferase